MNMLMFQLKKPKGMKHIPMVPTSSHLPKGIIIRIIPTYSFPSPPPSSPPPSPPPPPSTPFPPSSTFIPFLPSFLVDPIPPPPSLIDLFHLLFYLKPLFHLQLWM